MGLSDDNYEECENVVNRLNEATNLLVDNLLIRCIVDPEQRTEMNEEIATRTLDFLRPAQAEPCHDCGAVLNSLHAMELANEDLRKRNDTLQSLVNEYETPIYRAQVKALLDNMGTSTPATATETGASVENGETPAQAETVAGKLFEIVVGMTLRRNSTGDHYKLISQCEDGYCTVSRHDTEFTLANWEIQSWFTPVEVIA